MGKKFCFIRYQEQRRGRLAPIGRDLIQDLRRQPIELSNAYRVFVR